MTDERKVAASGYLDDLDATRVKNTLEAASALIILSRQGEDNCENARGVTKRSSATTAVP